MKFRIFLSALVLCSIVGAERSVAQNLLQNGEFNSNIYGWSKTGTCDPIWWDNTIGSPQLGSLAVNCFTAGSSGRAIQCVPALKTQNLDFFFRWSRNGSGIILPSVQSGVAAFDSADCSGPPLQDFSASSTQTISEPDCCGDFWHETSLLNIALPANTKSVLAYFGTDQLFSLAFDHVVLRSSVIYQDGFEINQGITGSWYNTQQSGHGFALEVLPTTPATLLAYWYVFEPDGGPIWIVASGPVEKDHAVMDGYQVDGPGAKFPPLFDPAKTASAKWGTLTFTFTDCDHGRVDYASSKAGYGSGTLALTRLTQPAGLSCA